MKQSDTIGARIKNLRTVKSLTLKQLSELSGYSVGFLSQVERGISSVAIDSLETIAQCLDTPLSGFFENRDDRGDDPVLHSFEQRFDPISPQITQAILSHHVREWQLLPRIFQLMPFPDDSEAPPELYTHGGEEFLYVLEGIVTVYLSDRVYTLYPGDSIQIDATLPHNWVNNTNKVTRMLYMNTPNPFRHHDIPPEFIP